MVSRSSHPGLSGLLVLFVACVFSALHSYCQPGRAGFAEYWYGGRAEISHYRLSEPRYGEQRDGSAVMIFVTEPFSLEKLVKSDKVDFRDSRQTTVLKLNYTKNFVTGIYPYSLMMSSFVPVEYSQYPYALKVTCSAQDWCGQSFSQISKSDGGYSWTERSYFESMGDFEIKLPLAYLEDAIWQTIRLNPDNLPIGSFKIIPSALFTRLQHFKPSVVDAEGRMEDSSQQALSRISPSPHRIYCYSFADREVEIHFRPDFPFQILGWEERNGKEVSSATLLESVNLDYWNRNKNKDRVLRKKLRLD